MTAACAFPDGVIHDHGNAQCHEASYEAGRRDALATPDPGARCTACRGSGVRLHGWALVPDRCRDCQGTGLAASPDSRLTTHVDLGAVWVERDGVLIRVDADELLPFMRSLRAHLDALEDAR